MPVLDSVEVSLSLPYLASIKGTWKPSKTERQAAWEMYVELVTRVPVATMHPEEGLLREALSSLYTLFGTTRSILRAHGPEVAQPKGPDQLSFGYLAVAVLNTSVRPILSKWHPLLLSYEGTRSPDVSPAQHERAWEHCGPLRDELADSRRVLMAYADILARVAGVPSLVIDLPTGDVIDSAS